MNARSHTPAGAGLIGLLTGVLFYLSEASIRFVHLYFWTDEQPPSGYLPFLLYHALAGLGGGWGIFLAARAWRKVTQSRDAATRRRAAALASAVAVALAALAALALGLSPESAARHLAAALALGAAVLAIGWPLAWLARRRGPARLAAGGGALALLLIAGHLVFLTSEPIRRLLPWSPTPSAPAARPNVLLLTVDTLRADRLGVYGHDSGTTPRIDRLALDSAVFQHAVAHSPWTQPSFGSLLTSAYPSQHGAFTLLDPDARDVTTGILYRSSLRDDVPTLAEILANRGYATLALQTNWSASAAQKFDRGFDLFLHHALFTPPMRDRCVMGFYGKKIVRRLGGGPFRSYLEMWPNADQVYRAFEALVADGFPRPFFIWVNFIDPHGPYLEREADTPIETARVVAAHDPWDASVPTAVLSSAYDDEVRFADHYAGRTLDLLRAHGVLDDTVVIVTSDHGEELGDRGVEIRSWRSAKGRLHGHSLYGELLRVPLLIRYPPRVPPGRVETLARQIDLVPTVLDLAAIDPGSAGARFEGVSLVGAMTGREEIEESEEPRLAFSERNLFGSQKRSVRDERHKLIVDLDSGDIELYDLADDPGERLDLAAERHDETRRLLGLLDAWAARMGPVVPPQPYPLPQTREDVERLRALGYIH